MPRRGEADGRLAFSGHESFPLRYAWLSKAVREVKKKDEVFTLDSAAGILGVGKNMAASIRHWALATGIIEPSELRGHVGISTLGSLLFDTDGWDPYLEDVGTTWLLHWQLIRAMDRASTWGLAFTRYPNSRFTRESLANWLFQLAEASPSTRATRSSIKRDVDVFIRTYLPNRGASDRLPEDSLDSPFTDLGLLREESGESTGETVFSFDRGFRSSLPNEILAYAIFDYWNRMMPGQRSTSFESLTYWEGSPGAAFKLSDQALGERLDDSLRAFGLWFDESAGIRVVFRDLISDQANDDASRFDVLHAYYRRSSI